MAGAGRWQAGAHPSQGSPADPEPRESALKHLYTVKKVIDFNGKIIHLVLQCLCINSSQMLLLCDALQGKRLSTTESQIVRSYRGIFKKLLRSSEINFKESIPPAYVAGRQPLPSRSLAPIDCSKIPSQFTPSLPKN